MRRVFAELATQSEENAKGLKTMNNNNIAPVFVLGSYRSGTSILTWCLGQHPNIWALPETYWLAEFARNTGELYRLGTVHGAAHFSRCGLTEEDFRLEAADFAHRLVRRGQERRVRKMLAHLMAGGTGPTHLQLQRAPMEPKRRWVDGTPENSHSVGVLLKLFPDAKFIHLIRSPHEVVRSLGKFDRAGGQAEAPEDGYATWFRLANAAFEAEQEFGSDTVRRFFHEDLKAQPEETLRAMLNFAGERFRPECLAPLSERINSSGVEEEEVLTLDTVPEALRHVFVENDKFFQTLKSTAKFTTKAD